MFTTAQAGDMELFKRHFAAAKAAGLGITLHIAEVRFRLVPYRLVCVDYEPDG